MFSAFSPPPLATSLNVTGLTVLAVGRLWNRILFPSRLFHECGTPTCFGS